MPYIQGNLIMAYIYIRLRFLALFPIRMLIGWSVDTRLSTSGYCVFVGDNLVPWSTKRQATCLSRFSAKVEYRGVAKIVSESCLLCIEASFRA